MASTWINAENMLRDLQATMNKELVAAAEPAIRRAIEEAEKEMRKRLAVMVVALLEESFSIERYGRDLRIIVKFEK